MFPWLVKASAGTKQPHFSVREKGSSRNAEAVPSKGSISDESHLLAARRVINAAIRVSFADRQRTRLPVPGQNLDDPAGELLARTEQENIFNLSKSFVHFTCLARNASTLSGYWPNQL
jgi:hypothetical protein